MGRSTRGVRVVNLQDGDTVAAMAILTHEDLNRGVDGGSRDEVDAVDGAAAELLIEEDSGVTVAEEEESDE